MSENSSYKHSMRRLMTQGVHLCDQANADIDAGVKSAIESGGLGALADLGITLSGDNMEAVRALPDEILNMVSVLAAYALGESIQRVMLAQD